MVISIGAEQTEAECLSWVISLDLTYMVLSDPTEAVFLQYGLSGYFPHNIVLDCDMNVLYTNTGFEDALIRSHIQTELTSVVGINHTPHPDTENTTDPIRVSSLFEADVPLTPGYPLLAWNTDGGGTFTETTMTLTRWAEYFADIPAMPEGTDVHYYIAADNDAGCMRTLPFRAPAELYRFHVGVDIIPPLIDHVHKPLIADEFLPLIISAKATDNLGIDSVVLEYRINGGSTVQLPMAERGMYAVEIPDTLLIGDEVEYRIIAADGAQVPNITCDPETGYHLSSIVDQIPVIIVDFDGSRNSGPVIRDTVTQLIGYCEYSNVIPEKWSAYHMMFVCLGVYGSGNHVLSSDEGQELVNYLLTGGRLYMEGGDTWYFDPQTPVHPYFNLSAVGDGTSDAGPVQGMAGTFTEGMYFNYQAGLEYNNWIDHLSPQTGSFAILQNVSPVYYNAIAYDSGSYKTIGSSIKIGGLIDPTETVSELVQGILVFFGDTSPSPTPAPPTNTPLPPTDTPIVPTATPMPPTDTPASPTATPMPPTDTPVPPTHTNIPTHTTIPTFTPVSPTETPVPPTDTPMSPTETPALPTETPAAPTETPIPPTETPGCDILGVTLWMPSEHFTPGDSCACRVTACNPGSQNYFDVPLFVILDVYGLYFFAPSFSEFDHCEIDLVPGLKEIEVLPEFTWPQGAGSASGILWYAAMTDPGITQLFGNMDTFTFGWGE